VNLYPVQAETKNYISDLTTSEKELSQWWSQVLPGSTFHAKQGGQVIVFSPGRLNENDGPDYLDAVFSYSGNIYRGDVELHLHESDWVNHRHSHQPRYKQVLLHVVMTLNQKPCSPLLTIKVPTSIRKGKVCQLPQKYLSSKQLNSVFQLGIQRWERRIQEFKDAQESLNELFLSESLACFGSGENRRLFRQLGQDLIPFLEKSFDDWEQLFKTLIHQIQWHHKGVRPTAYPEKRLNKLCYLSYELFRCGPIKPTQSLLNSFLSIGFGKGTYVEWMGHVNLPALLSKYTDRENYYLNEWTQLQLPSPYGILSKSFGHQIHRKQLCSFPLAQGLLNLKLKYCQQATCSTCPVLENTI